MIAKLRRLVESGLVHKLAIMVSFLLLCLSLTQPAFTIDNPKDPYSLSNSYWLFCFGWAGGIQGAVFSFVIWLANPIYFISIFLSFKERFVGLFYSVISLFLAVTFAVQDSMMFSESGSYTKITSLKLGYWLWMSCFMVLSVGNLLCLIFEKKKVSTQ